MSSKTPPDSAVLHRFHGRNAIILVLLGALIVTAAAAAVFRNLPTSEAPWVPEVPSKSGSLVPTVSAHTPSSDAIDVPTDTKITVIFNHPMVPLAQVQGSPSSMQWGNWPVTISPAPRGTWRWLSTYAAQFTPERGLNPATLYTVSVPAGIEDVSGSKTTADASWHFETPRATLISTDPYDGFSIAGPSTTVTLTFNQEMNPESAARHITMSKMSPGSSGTTIAIKSIGFGKATDNGKTITDKHSLILTPSKPLELHSSYVVTMTPGILGAVGDLGSLSGSTLHFSTVGPLAVETASYQYGTIQMRFTSPVRSDVDLTGISLSPPVAKGETLSVSLNSWGDNRELTISPSALQPSTSYTLTVGTKFTDEYGQHLAEPYTLTFTTPPVDPEVALAYSKGEFGIFERDKTPVYYINDVNVSAVNVEFAKLSLKDFMDVRRQKAGKWDFVPSLSGKELYKKLTLAPGGKKDSWESIAFDVQKRMGVTLKPGIYALLLTAPEYKDYNGQPVTIQQYFAVTNTALTLKYSGDKALVWATDLQTGQPVQGASITFQSMLGTTPLRGKTDASGFFESPISMQDFKNQPYDWQPEFWVTLEKDGDFAFVGSQWNGGYNQNGMSIWTDFHSPMSAPYRMMHELITDRPVYRPGDTVSFKGIVRLKDWNGMLQLPGTARQMQVTIQDPNGTEVYKKTLPFTDYGGFSDTFKTADAAVIGTYGVSLQLLPESDVGGPSYDGAFSVLAYRKPEYKVDLKSTQEDYVSGDTMQVDLTGAYYFGAPLSNAPVNWRVTLTDYFFNRYTDGWYSFSTEDAWCWWICNPQSSSLTEGKGMLDATGHMHLRVPVSIDDKKVSQIATIEADVTDPNNQLVSNRVSVPVHKSRVYVGIRNEDYAVAPGEKARLALVTADPNGKALGNQTVTLTLSSRVWNSIRKKGVDGQYTYENETVDTFVSDQRVTTGADGKVTAEVLVPAGGGYVVTAEVSDSSGRIGRAGTSLYAWSSTYVNWPHENDNSISVIADKPEYAVGDTAKLLVKSPFQGKGVKALVTVERENVMMKSVVDVTGNALPIEVPITEDLIPNVYVSVVIVKPRVGETFDDEGKDTGVPAFRIGYVQLHVETARKKLRVSIDTDKKQYLPGESVTASVVARDATGKPVQGEFTFAAVDMSVLALAGFSMPDLVKNFYADHGLGVQTAQMLTYLIERFKPGSKGGGGGELADRKRGNFRDTAYWNPTVLTDEKGTATVNFTLPDNLTTWQFLALGSTKDGRFGAAEKEVLETKNVIVRPVRPRFAVHGDKITLGAIVHNFLPATHTFTVSLTGAGFTHSGKAEQSISIKAGDEVKVLFPVVVGNSEELTLNMRAETDGGRDEIEEKIPVYIFGTPQSVASTGITESLVTEKVVVPSTKDASSGDLTVSVSPSMATYLPGGLEYLVKYPYGCAEQTASTFLPQLMLKKLQGFEAFHIASDATLDADITVSLQKLYRFQKSDGGFGYWEDGYSSTPYLTAYVLYALRSAKDTGYAVDDYVLKRAADYLGNVLRATSPENRSIPTLDLATRAYILFVLSESGRPDANLLSNLYDQRAQLPVFSQAELAMSLQKAGMQKKAKELLTHVLDNAKIDPRGAHVEEARESEYRQLMQNNTRTTAEVLQAMIRLDQENVLVPQFIRYLLTTRKDGHWDTTQSTVQTILALVEYLKASGELDGQFTAGVDINGKMVVTQKFGTENILTRNEVTIALDDLLRGKENTVKIGMDGKGKLFYDILMSYFYTGDTIAPAEQGISILREINAVDQKDDTNLSSVKVGNTYRVTLTMTVPQDRHFVAVESPHPGGLEGIDLQLKTSAQTGLPDDVTTQQDSSPYWWWDSDMENALWRFNHKEFRDDRVFLFADELPAGVYKYTYLVRATTPGTFRLRPAHIFEMYYPETFGQTEGTWFTVKE